MREKDAFEGVTLGVGTANKNNNISSRKNLLDSDIPSNLVSGEGGTASRWPPTTFANTESGAAAVCPDNNKFLEPNGCSMYQCCRRPQPPHSVMRNKPGAEVRSVHQRHTGQAQWDTPSRGRYRKKPCWCLCYLELVNHLVSYRVQQRKPDQRNMDDSDTLPLNATTTFLIGSEALR